MQRAADALRESEARTKAAEARQRTLAHELNHRVKNIMPLVQALARQSFRGTDVPKAALSVFEGCLAAQSDAHELLVRRQGAGICPSAYSFRPRPTLPSG
ncbi:hypothetical protein NO934_06910 [Pelagibacterium sp. H642]|nr:hypothetical protein NO934_06910 [Pelagibacterium sp. H642]